LPTLNAKEAEKILIALGYELLRTKGSHRIYGKASERFVLPFHSGKDLHPKIVKSLMELTQNQ
jgi:predicted RNA binding protein YcfA (HicA-like mRNA interferase family)